MKRSLLLVVLLVALFGFVWAGGQSEESSQARTDETQEEVVIRVRAFQPEYMAQDRQIWDIFEEEHPGVRIELLSVNEPEEPSYYAKIAAGELPVHLSLREEISKESYENYVNLLDIDFPHWDVFTYDAQSLFEDYEGIEGVQPYVQPFSGPTFTFIYHRDMMEAAGVDPKQSVRTLDDLEDLLGELKEYVDSTDDVDFVWTTGWIPRGVMQNWASAVHYAHDRYLGEQRELYLGERSWTNLEENPFTAYFTFFKEMYDKGYLPQEWWLRDWETDFEASFISKRAMLAFHGPWLWDKVLAANPEAQLDGIPMPAADNGRVWTRPADPAGAAILKGSMDEPHWELIKEAFYWWHRPETLKMWLESYVVGNPLVDLSSVGGANIQSPQYINVLKPFSEGFWWDWKWDNGKLGELAAAPFKDEGAPNVMMDSSNVPLIGDYYTGEITLEEMMEVFQRRWENAYPELAD